MVAFPRLVSSQRDTHSHQEMLQCWCTLKVCVCARACACVLSDPQLWMRTVEAIRAFDSKPNRGCGWIVTPQWSSDDTISFVSSIRTSPDSWACAN